jgi:peptide/nickel transport system substrate-binding protein
MQSKLAQLIVVTLAALWANAYMASPALCQNEPKRRDTLVFGINSGEPPTYDRHQSTLFPIIHLLSPHYSNLLRNSNLLRIDLAHYPNRMGHLAEVGRSPKTLRPTASAFAQAPNSTMAPPFPPRMSKASYERMHNPPQGIVSVRQGLVRTSTRSRRRTRSASFV